MSRRKSSANSAGAVAKFEDLLSLVGAPGRWQLEVLVVGLVMGTVVISQSHNYVFLMAVPEHWCRLPSLKGAAENWTLLRLKDVALPTETRNGRPAHSQCSRMRVASDQRLLDLLQRPWEEGVRVQEEQELLPGHDNDTVPCEHWDYDRTTFRETTVSEWDLVCDRAALRSTLISSMILGNLLGSLIGGILSDKLGRRLACILGGVVLAVGSVSSAFAPSYAYLLALRLVNGAGSLGLFTCAFTLMIEIVSTEDRAKWNNYFDMGPALAFFLSAALAHFFSTWRTIQLAGALPSIPLIFVIWWYLLESPRWLLTKGRVEDAQRLLALVAAKNGREVPPEVLSATVEAVRKELQKEQQSSSSGGGGRGGFLRRAGAWLKSNMAQVCGHEFRSRSLKMALCWFVTAFIVYAVVYINSRLDVGPVVAITLQGVMVTLSRVTIWWPLDHWGRKGTFCSAFFAAGGLMLAVAFVPAHLTWLVLSLFLVVTFNVTTLFSVVYLITAELFPTHVRNLAIGAGSVCARLGGMASPYVVDLLGRYSYFVPNVVLGIAGVLAGVVSLTLPETRKKKLPDTVQDVEGTLTQNQKHSSADSEPSVWTTSASSALHGTNGINHKEITRL